MFPQQASEFIFDNTHQIIQNAGDAVIVKRCSPVKNYKVFWNQTISGSCFKLFPVLTNNVTLFLDLKNRRLHSSSPTTRCPPRAHDIFIFDIQSQLWILRTNNTFSKVNDLRTHSRLGSIDLPKLALYDERILHADRYPPPQDSLLSLLSSNMDSIEEMSKLRHSGGGDILLGITTGLTSLLNTVADDSGDFLQKASISFKTAITGVSEAGSNIVTSTTQGVSTILSSFGSNLLFWILLGLLILFLVSQFVPTSPFRILDLKKSTTAPFTPRTQNETDKSTNQGLKTHSPHKRRAVTLSSLSPPPVAKKRFDPKLALTKRKPIPK